MRAIVFTFQTTDGPLALEIGALRSTFRYPSRAAAHEAIAPLVAQARAGELQGVSVNAWAFTLTGSGYVTVLSEDHSVLHDPFAAACAQLMGEPVEAHEGMLEALIAKRARSLLGEGADAGHDPHGPLGVGLRPDGTLELEDR